MSTLFDLRQALANSIVAANIGWTSDIIVLKRQSDLWNDLITAIATSKIGACLHIGVASGKADPDSTDIDFDLTISLTIVIDPSPAPDVTPEEDLWELLVKHVHNLYLDAWSAFQFRFRIDSFDDIEITSPDNSSSSLGRQTIFKVRLIIPASP